MPVNQMQLQELITQKVEPGSASFTQQFAARLFEKAPRELTDALSGDDLLSIALNAIEFVKQRQDDEILARVYSPSREEHGWSAPFTVIELCLSDRPFIVDSMRAAILGAGHKLQHFLHPILDFKRDSSGRLIQKLGDDGSKPEAYEIFLVERIENPEELTKLEQRIRKVLTDVLLATSDYAAMKSKTEEIRNYLLDLELRMHELATEDGPADVKEYIEFMNWLLDDNFVFLGYREYHIDDFKGVRAMRVVPETALGILRQLASSTYYRPVPMDQISEDLRNRITRGPILLVTKSNAESTVHRPARMDYIGVKQFDRQGRPAGERRFLGLFTSKAHSTPVDHIPILRRKLKQVLTLDDAVEGSHDFKQIVTLFNSIPREELFWSAPRQLHRDIRTIMSIEQERGVRLTVRPDPLKRGLALMVIMPRERFNSDVRMRIQEMLTRKLEATHVDYNLAIGEDEEQVRFHFFFVTDKSLESIDLPALDREVAEITRTWEDRLREKLLKVQREPGAEDLAECYSRAFDEAYKQDNSPEDALRDIEHLQALKKEAYQIDLVNRSSARAQATSYLRIYHREATLVLSEVFPLLENLGLKVLEQISYPVAAGNNGSTPSLGIDVFRVRDQQDRPLPEGDAAPVKEALQALLSREAENDSLNQLVLRAGLSIHQVALLRTYRGYLAQLQAARSRSFITETLLSYPASARAIWQYFESKFRPMAKKKRSPQLRKARDHFQQSLEQVSSLPEDETLRALFLLVDATVRTNFFLGKPFISLKIESAKVLEMPEPRPLYEIVVSARDVEGIHLRGGMVARGGIRWSDRPDDYRTEILGLMKTQMTKNAVIVPVGSKGGFVLKHAPTDRDGLRAHVQAQYKVFIRGLLDLTDNIIDGKVVHPRQLEVYDQPDPYLVVAADKGTATFSDIANQISKEYQFWLGDAFASGGSHGYDHKKEGITARGAWECVSRHFRELGIDVRKHPFTVVGIGDMSGDVFGNGMLYTPQIGLVAAFNHQHIFIDPQPDRAAAFAERKRLFDMPRSSWSDYDPTKVSTGGGIFSRGAKSIPLSPEIQKLLGTTQEALSGQDLIKRLLTLPVDLLWNGGIGTYVKASSERNSDVGDSANDAVRVDASDVNAKIVGEGGNLGCTQLARIEYCLAGGRMNTDAIDNSAGVDMSDHEVNIKILLQPMLRNGILSFEDRNQLLESMTDDVSRLVLADNYCQSLCLSLAERADRRDGELFASLLDYLVGKENLKRHVEFLPDAQELARRRRNGQGFTRPELAILLAYTKMGLSRHLLDTDLPDEAHLQHYLVEYFPKELQQRYVEAMKSHPLRREIIACQITNTLIDRLGIGFVHSAIRNTAASPEEVTRTALAALEILDLWRLWEDIFKTDNRVPSKHQYAALEEVILAVEGIVQWILLADLDIQDLSAFVNIYRDPLAELRKDLANLLPVSERKRYEAHRKRLSSAGFPSELAGELAAMEYLTSGMGVIDVSRTSQLSWDEAARHFYGLGDRLQMGWLRDHLAEAPKTTHWEKIAATGLVMDLRNLQKQLTLAYIRVLAEDPKLSVAAFLSRVDRDVKRFDQTLWEVRTKEPHLSLGSGAVITRILERLTEKAGRAAETAG